MTLPMLRDSDINKTPKVALITGGASGIGKVIAEVLASKDTTVVISDINTEQGVVVAESLGGFYVPADLTHTEDCKQLIQKATQLCGGVDILINNAGIQHVSSIEDFPLDKWVNMIQLMLIAPFVLTQQVWSHMKQQQWGRIVNMGSIHSLVASLNKSAYISAKHGLIGLTKSAALEGGEYGITVNAVCPAYVKTPLVENQIADQAKTLNLSQDQVEMEVMLKSAAIKRMIEPYEVAELVFYLCSDKAGAVTGATWNIDLGWTAQ